MFQTIANAGLTATLILLLRFYPSPEPKVFRGQGSMQELAGQVAADGHKSVLLVTTNGFVKRKTIEPILEALREHGIRVEIYSDIPPNPTLDLVERGSALCHERNCEAIYAFGGGSVLDAAKGIAAQVGNEVPARQLIGIFKLRKKAHPLYMVPSTSGSGSEVSNVAVLSDPDTHQKLFLFDHKSVPLAVALDPLATATLPPGITAATGMDAMTHAIESYISRIADQKSAELASSAIRAIFEHLPSAYREGDNLWARESMANAAYEAGEAFTRAGLGFVHAISHQITAFYGVPHGVANAVILPHVLEVSKSKAAPALAQLAKENGLEKPGMDNDQLADLFIEKIRQLSAELELPTGFPEMKDTDFPTIAKNAIKEATFNFPVPKMLTSSECQAILARLKQG